MRYFIFIGFCFLILTSINAQSIEDSVRIDFVADELPLETVFTELEEEYGIRFSYATEAIGDKKVNANFKDKSIEEVMDYLLMGERMEYKVIADNVLLRKMADYKTQEDERYRKGMHIRGKVTQADENEAALPFAAIFVENSSVGTYSDENGNFDLEIPANYKEEKITIHYLGFKDVTYEIKELESEILIVSLNNEPFSVSEVMIVNRQKPVRINALKNSMSLSNSQLDNMTSGLAGVDLAKQVQLLPGVAAFDDASADIKIRGSKADETLMILDGMPIYNASHYYGIFSSINTDFVDSVNVYKNIFPLEYGGKTAGIVEMLSDDKQVDKINVKANVNLLTASSVIKVPISSKSMLSLAGRSTLKDVSNSQFNTVSSNSFVNDNEQSFLDPIPSEKINPNFNFWDVNGKFQWMPSEKDYLSLNFFKSSDEYKVSYNRFRKDRNADELNLAASEFETWSSVAGSMQYKRGLSNKLSLNSCISFSQYKNDSEIDFKLDKKQGQDRPPQLNFNAKQANDLKDINVDAHLNFKILNGTFKSGLAATRHDIEYNFIENKRNQLKGDEVVYKGSVYAGYEVLLAKKINLNTGLRVTYYDKEERLYWSPRALVNYNFTNNLSLKSSFSYYQQFIREFEYEYLGENKYLWVNAGLNKVPVLETQNFMVGGTAILKKFTIDIEAYHKNMDGLTEYSVVQPGRNNDGNPRDYFTFVGDGRSTGIDILLSSAYKKYNTYLAYTLSKTEQRYEKIYNGDHFATDDDRRHQLKWINSYKFGDFLFGMDCIFASGRPYTDANKLGANGDIRNASPENGISTLPSYKRLDLSVAYNFNLLNQKSKLSFSIFNVLNTQNVKYIQNVNSEIQRNQVPISTVIGSEASLLNRTFNLSFTMSVK